LTPEILAVYAVSADEKIDDKGCSVKITVDHEKFADVLPILVRRGMIGDGCPPTTPATRYHLWNLPGR
jgi:hypothetical protein